MLSQSVLAARDCGLRELWDAVGSTDDMTSETVAIRSAYERLSHAVLYAYGWEDLACDFGFFQDERGIRFGVDPQTAQLILRRLLQLNHRRTTDR